MDRGDADHVARALAGDPEAYKALVERHGTRVFRIAFRITGSEADAEDVVQETFWKAYDGLDRFEPGSGFGAWIGRIAANNAIDLLRARRRRARLVVVTEEASATAEATAAPGPSPERIVQRTEMQGQVERAMEILTERERAAFVLRHFEERSIREIAAGLSQTENATKQALFRAVRKLRRALAPEAAASNGS